MKLFCFPHAGASASAFSKWEKELDPRIELRPIELAGRGRRIHEPLYGSLSAVIDDILAQTQYELRTASYCLLGHSMGSLIAWELAQRIMNNGWPGPRHIFFSGRGAPHIVRDDEKLYHRMNEIEFKKNVIELGGTPREFFDHPELLELFVPLLRNDFRIAETPPCDEAVRPLECNITVLMGKSDSHSVEECDGWKVHTNKLCTIHHFVGGHFFLYEAGNNIPELINNTLFGSYAASFSRTIMQDIR
jgi:surfactin synthase thioesterase subunit